MSDHYQTLGVDRNSTPEEIKRAYRKLAAQHHPDRGGDTARFQEIQVAYDTLSDPNKRSQYDNPAPQFNGGFPGGEFQFHGGIPPGFEAIFAQFGGNPFGFGQQPQRNKTLNLNTDITLEEAFEGKDLIANVTLPSGRNQTLEVKIPKGISDGTTLRLNGMGDDSYQHLPRGDIHLTIRILPHAKFARQGDDLVYQLQVDAIDAILGKVYTINTIDNRILDVTINPGTQPGQILAANGYGMPRMNDPRFTGRLLMRININIPTDLTMQQRSQLRDIFLK